MRASLPMYDLPEVAAATAAWWESLARAFRTEGIAEVPDRLTACPPLPEHWLHPDLLFSQSCGYPLTHALFGKVRLVATPCYDAPGCAGPIYRSLLIVAEDSRAGALDDLRWARCAFNSADSQSGYNVLRAMAVPLARQGRFFSATVQTGSHRASIAAVRSGAAEVCAVDCVTHALLARHAPSALAGTRVLCETPAAPSLPYVTSAAADDALVERMRAAITRAIADPSAAAARDALLIAGAATLDLADYAPVLEMERAAAAAGYATLA